jgi:ribosomal protein S18 acetylase RimI-like enzyme
VAFEIRPVQVRDYGALGSVTAEVYAVVYPPIEEARAAVREMRDVTPRVAEAETTFVAVETGGEKVLGGVSFVLSGSKHANLARAGEGEFRLLAVDPAARGQGVGQALVRACLDRAAELGLERVVLLTQDDMLEAQRLYDRMGFKRATDRDWEPVPGVRLLAYAIDV